MCVGCPPATSASPPPPAAESVTCHNTYVWGGERYGLVVVYATEEKLNRLIDDIKNSPPVEGQNKVVEALIQKLLAQLFPLQHGILLPGGSTEDARQFRDAVKDYMEDFKAVKALFAANGPVDWWKKEGSRCSAEDGYYNVHPSVRGCFNQIIIHQGDGSHLFDDRVYIKTVLSELIDAEHKPVERRQTAMAALIEEVHLTVPSVELDCNTALVDTPGVNDMDAVKFAQLRDAVERSSGFLVQLDATLKTDASVIAALKAHDVFKRVAQSWSAGDRRKDSALFMHSYEKGRCNNDGAPRPRPEEDPLSLIHSDQKAELDREVDKAKDSIRETMFDAVMELLDEGLKLNVKTGGDASQSHELSKAAFPEVKDRRA